MGLWCLYNWKCTEFTFLNNEGKLIEIIFFLTAWVGEVAKLVFKRSKWRLHHCMYKIFTHSKCIEHLWHLWHKWKTFLFTSVSQHSSRESISSSFFLKWRFLKVQFFPSVKASRMKHIQQGTSETGNGLLKVFPSSSVHFSSCFDWFWLVLVPQKCYEWSLKRPQPFGNIMEAHCTGRQVLHVRVSMFKVPLYITKVLAQFSVMCEISRACGK